MMTRLGYQRFWFAPIVMGLVFGILSPSPGLTEGVSPELFQEIQSAPDDKHSVILRLPKNGMLYKPLLKGKSKSERNRTVVKDLRMTAEKEQKSLLKSLETYAGKIRAEKVRPFWIVNAVALTALTEEIVQLAGQFPESDIVPDRPVTLGKTFLSLSGPAEWNLEKIKAPDLWGLGFQGEGVVVAILDTGVDSFHPDLAGTYRGGNNSWFDPFGEDVIGRPTDPSEHGTEVAGIIVGGNASGTAIGIAPGAQWIAAKVFPNIGVSSESAVLAALEWVLDPDGNPATDDSPHIVNNSWEIDDARSSCAATPIQEAIANIRSAGILPVFASGNSGWPVTPAAYPESVAVGYTDQNDTVAADSGSGSTACAGRTFYPNLVAPGEGVRTTRWTSAGLITDPNQIYHSVTGSSFASAHVSGVAALLLSAYPNLNIETIQAALEASAVDLGASGPDSVYGYGRIDVKAAYDLIPLSPSDVHVKNSSSGTYEIYWASLPGVNYTLRRNGSVLSQSAQSPYADQPGSDAGSYTYAVTTVVSGLESAPAYGLLGNMNQANNITRNRVDAFDLSTLRSALGSSQGDPNWNDAADLNGDGIVDATDQSMLSTHFGQVVK